MLQMVAAPPNKFAAKRRSENLREKIKSVITFSTDLRMQTKKQKDPDHSAEFGQSDGLCC